MATSPVTLDLSKAQPISGITLDLSKSQPIVGAPVQQSGMKLGFTGQMDPQTRQFEDVSVDQPPQAPAIERFARSFNKAVTGSETPQRSSPELAGQFQGRNGQRVRASRWDADYQRYSSGNAGLMGTSRK